MSVIFVGSTVDRETLKTLRDASVAGNKMELGFMHGFASNGIKTMGISVEAYGMWRFNQQPRIVRAKQLKEGDLPIKTVSYINIPVIKQVIIPYQLKREIRKALATDEFKNSTIVVYNTMSIFVRPVLKVAKRYGLNAIAVVADLPIQEKKNIIRRIEDRRQMNAIGLASAIIPLTEYISKDFASNIPHCVVEAGCNPEDYQTEEIRQEIRKRKEIVFSGTLNQLSGIELIINAMKKVKDPDVILNIYGDGPLKTYVEKEAATSGNVNYLGRVTNDQMMAIQKSAALLVCPRKKDDFTTKYTFPSKILEYICSGVPVLSNRLLGIPDEYERYINYPVSESESDWANAIEAIFQKNHYDTYAQKAQQAREIVMGSKSWTKQVERVLNQMKRQGIQIR